MDHEIHVVERPALRVVSKRSRVPIEEIGPTLAQAFSEAYAAIGAAGVAPAGAPFVIYYSMPEPGVPLDIEVCAPVTGTLAPPALWRVVDLPAGTFANCLHVGSYDSVGSTYDALSTWIPANGFAFAGPPREVYLSPPETPSEQTQTVIEFPVMRVPGAVG
jgi:effector-binding domain-containing protein